MALFEAVVHLFHAIDPAVVLGYAGRTQKNCRSLGVDVEKKLAELGRQF